MRVQRVIKDGKTYLIIDGGLEVDTIAASGAVTIGGDLTVSGDFTEELDESLLGDLTMGTATAAGGDITVYEDASGNISLSFDADAASLILGDADTELGDFTIYGKNGTVLSLGDATHEGGDIIIYKDTSGNIAFQIDADTGQLTLPVTGSGAGLLLGGDAQIYHLAANTLCVTTGDSLAFRDATIYITSDDDGHLDLMADVSIDLNTGAETDLILNFFGTTNSGVLTWMEDEDYFKFSDDILMSGTEKIQFNATTEYINSGAAGYLDIAATTNIRMGIAVDFQNNDALNLGAAGNDLSSSNTLVATTFSGAIDMGNNIISHIGAAGTDFSATGGLTLADALTVEDAVGPAITASVSDATTNVYKIPVDLLHETSGDMVDGFGSALRFRIKEAVT